MKKKILYFSCKSGILLGFLLALITFFFFNYDAYQLMPHYNVYYVCFYITFLIFPIIISFLFLKQHQKIGFKDLFSIIFLILCNSIFIHTIFTWLLYNLIEPNLIIQYADYMLDKISSSQIESIDLDNVYSNLLSSFSLTNQLHSYVFFLIPCILYSTILSLFMKKLF